MLKVKGSDYLFIQALDRLCNIASECSSVRIATSSTSSYPRLLRSTAISFKKTCCNLVGERGGGVSVAMMTSLLISCRLFSRVLCVFAPTQCELIVCEIPPQWLPATKDK